MSPAYSGGLRPKRSDAGPNTHGPMAMPRKNTVISSPTCDEPGGMPYSARTSAKAGSIRSIASAAEAISTVTSATNSRPVASPRRRVTGGQTRSMITAGAMPPAAHIVISP